jgi:predicted aspartyl protease
MKREKRWVVGSAGALVVAGVITLLMASRTEVGPREHAADTVALEAGLPADAPLRLENGRIVVPVVVDGIPARFIVDTAAENSAIARALAERLDLDGSRVGRIRVIGVGGTRIMPVVALRTLVLAGAVVEDIRAVVVDGGLLGGDGGYDGLLGNDFLRRFDVEIDGPAGRIRLYTSANRDAGALGADLTAVPMTGMREGFVAFDAALSGSRVHAILDTGTPVSLVNWKAAALGGVSADTRGVRTRRGGTAGLDGASMETHLFTFDGLALGPTTFPRTTLRIGDLPLFAVAGVSDEPAMLVGVDLLRTCRVILAYGTRTLHLCRRAMN